MSAAERYTPNEEHDSSFAASPAPAQGGRRFLRPAEEHGRQQMWRFLGLSISIALLVACLVVLALPTSTRALTDVSTVLAGLFGVFAIPALADFMRAPATQRRRAKTRNVAPKAFRAADSESRA